MMHANRNRLNLWESRVNPLRSSRNAENPGVVRMPGSSLDVDLYRDTVVYEL